MACADKANVSAVAAKTARPCQQAGLFAQRLPGGQAEVNDGRTHALTCSPAPVETRHSGPRDGCHARFVSASAAYPYFWSMLVIGTVTSGGMQLG